MYSQKIKTKEEDQVLNHITIMGRLTRDPELRRTGSGIAVVNFSVAVERDFKSEGGEKETDFIDCVAWRQIGEFVNKYFTKGAMIVVSGRLQVRSWTDNDGNKRRTAEIVADNVYFGESKRSAESAGTHPTATPASAAVPIAPSADDYALLDEDDGQLPF